MWSKLCLDFQRSKPRIRKSKRVTSGKEGTVTFPVEGVTPVGGLPAKAAVVTLTDRVKALESFMSEARQAIIGLRDKVFPPCKVNEPSSDGVPEWHARDVVTTSTIAIELMATLADVHRVLRKSSDVRPVQVSESICLYPRAAVGFVETALSHEGNSDA